MRYLQFAVLFLLFSCPLQRIPDARKLIDDTPSVRSEAGVDPCRRAYSEFDRKLCSSLMNAVVTKMTNPMGTDKPPDLLPYVVTVVNQQYKVNDPKKPDECKGFCRSSGTGTIVAPGVVLTARHVVKESVYIKINVPEYNDKGVLTGYSRDILMNVKKSGDPDYAILVVAHKEDVQFFPKEYVIKIPYKVRPPEGAYVWHFGKTTGPQMGRIISTRAACGQLHSRIPMDIKIDYGDSGSGLLVGNMLVGLVMKMNSEVCQSSFDQMFKDIGFEP